MSRIGKHPIAIPAGVDVTIDGSTVTVKGPKGQLSEKISPRMELGLEDGVFSVKRPTDNKEDRALHGLSRSLINNMVIGVTNGYQRTLI